MVESTSSNSVIKDLNLKDRGTETVQVAEALACDRSGAVASLWMGKATGKSPNIKAIWPPCRSRATKARGTFSTNVTPCFPSLTNSDLDVVPGGGVFEVVDGAQHVQCHVADVVCVKGGLVGHARHHHVGITDRLHLVQKRPVGFSDRSLCKTASENSAAFYELTL